MPRLSFCMTRPDRPVTIPAHADRAISLCGNGTLRAPTGREDGGGNRGGAVRFTPGDRPGAADRETPGASGPHGHPVHRVELPRARRRERVGDPRKPDAV